jgi:RNA polymerase sigma-70 factor (TIGR02943 family)
MGSDNSRIDFDQLVEEYSDMLFGFALVRVGNEALAKDLVQETFIKAYKNEEKLAELQSVKSWLFTVLKNGIIDHYRSLSGRMDRNTVEIDYKTFFNESGMWHGDKMPSDWLSTYDAKKESDFIRLQEILRKCISELKDVPAAVIKMKYLDDVESEEICKTMEISSSNYWVIVHRAKLKLRSCVEHLLSENRKEEEL